MANQTSDTTQVKSWLDLMRAGDQSARGRLIEHTCERLRLLTRKMLHGFPRVHRWEETDDVFTAAMTKLHQCLETFQPESPKHFYNLAATHIRRVLIGMARRYCGPMGLGANYDTNAERGETPRYEATDTTDEPSTLMEWTDFHEQVEGLPDEEREVFNLLWYEGLEQSKAAEMLGISERTLRRRWQDARARLRAARMGENLPND
jgi:RNA polymerase sigma-70 factor (ECF subfamily)